jgi:hypothetical protein
LFHADRGTDMKKITATFSQFFKRAVKQKVELLFVYFSLCYPCTGIMYEK